MIPDPKLSRIFSLGLTHDQPPRPPAVSVLVGGICYTVQPDGQIALFNQAGMFSCECRGHEISGLPSTADLMIVLSVNEVKVKIYREDRVFYSKRGGIYRMFANYFPGSKAAPVGMAHTPQEIGNDTDGNMCHLFHTDDQDIEDYREQSDREESPVPLTPPNSDD